MMTQSSVFLNCGKSTYLHQSWEIQNSIERDSIAEFEPDRFVGPVHWTNKGSNKKK